MSSSIDIGHVIVVKLHLGVDQLGPGSEATTARAFAAVGDLPADARILDLGCGAGRQTRTLAALAPTATIRAVDLLPPFVEHAQAALAAAGVDDRARAEVGSMIDPALGQPPSDLIWCEGAIYNVGVPEALAVWRDFLRPGGVVAFSEASWLVADPPERARAMWAEEYPSMRSVEDNLAVIEASGFEVLDHFTQPPSDWHAYYANLADNHAKLREEFADNADALAELDRYYQEQDVYRECSDSYGYEFFIARMR